MCSTFTLWGLRARANGRTVVLCAGISAGFFSLWVCEGVPATSPISVPAPKLCTLQSEAQHRAGQSGMGNGAVFCLLHPTRAIPVSSFHWCAHLLQSHTPVVPRTSPAECSVQPCCWQEGSRGCPTHHQAGVLLRLCSAIPQPLYLDNQAFFLCFCWPLVEARQMKRKIEKIRIWVVGGQKGQ